MQYRRIWERTQKGKLFLVIFLITSKKFHHFWTSGRSRLWILKLELWKIGVNQKGRGPACQPHPPLKRTRHHLVTALTMRGHAAAPPPHAAVPPSRAGHAVSPPRALPFDLILAKQRRGGNSSFAAALLLAIEWSRAFLCSYCVMVILCSYCVMVTGQSSLFLFWLR
jgi:hypothetical protein